MSRKELNILENVFISKDKNKLQLCDILFSSKIKEIKPKTEVLLEWEDIREKSQRNKLLNQLIEHDESKDIHLAIPGGIDPHVHFDTPGFEFREDFEHGSDASICGGTTTIIDMPCTSLPPVTSLKNLKIKKDALKGKGNVNSFFWGGVRGNDFNEADTKKNIYELADAGVVGFKVYMTSGMESFSDLNEQQLKIVARIIEQTGKPMAVHAEDKDLVAYREKRFKTMNRNDWKAYCESRDIQAESSAVNKLISISEDTGCRIHVVHLSSKLALKSIKDAQNRSINISTETCPHYLHFTQSDFENDLIKNYLKTAPPVKFDDDRNALWEGLADNSIMFVTTDHAGCNPIHEKTSENFWNVYGGIPGVEHRVRFLFSEGFWENKITLEQTVKLLSSNAADFFKLNNKGKLLAGYDSDITLIDLWDSKRIRAEEMHSKGKYTPFDQELLKTVIKKVFVNGNLVYS